MATFSTPVRRQDIRVHLVPSVDYFYTNHPSDPNEILLLNFKGEGCHTFNIKCKVSLAEDLISHGTDLGLIYVEDKEVGPEYRVLRIDFCGKNWQQAYCHFREKLSGIYRLIEVNNPFHCI